MGYCQKLEWPYICIFLNSLSFLTLWSGLNYGCVGWLYFECMTKIALEKKIAIHIKAMVSLDGKGENSKVLTASMGGLYGLGSIARAESTHWQGRGTFRPRGAQIDEGLVRCNKKENCILYCLGGLLNPASERVFLFLSRGGGLGAGGWWSINGW